jgi:hypothetical protein
MKKTIYTMYDNSQLYCLTSVKKGKKGNGPCFTWRPLSLPVKLTKKHGLKLGADKKEALFDFYREAGVRFPAFIDNDDQKDVIVLFDIDHVATGQLDFSIGREKKEVLYLIAFLMEDGPITESEREETAEQVIREAARYYSLSETEREAAETVLDSVVDIVDLYYSKSGLYDYYEKLVDDFIKEQKA